ncbi:dihydrolipoamide acyltransferase [candidate division KSB1 bacterium]|nr:dihydrolipoamide acyltransferase [candidate division KSB1 bacterium]
MAIKMTMPKLSDTMEEGTIIKWLKKEGEAIKAGQVVAEAESDKATMELEAFDEGILKKIVVPEGGKVGVGGLIAVIGEEDEDISDILEANEEDTKPEPEKTKETNKTETESKAPEPPKPAVAAPPPTTVSPPAKTDIKTASDGTRLKASPLAKKLAGEKGVNLRSLQGSGTGGRIIRRDVINFLDKVQNSEAAEKEPVKVNLTTMRDVISRRMTLSKTTIPHFYLTTEVDVRKTAEFRKALNESQSDIKISFNDIIVKAVSLALKKHKNINASFAGDHILQHDRIDIGVAVTLDEGLITPVVRNCDQKSIGDISKEIRSMVKRAKERKLVPEEYTKATFTISNLGMYNIEEFSAIINPPEAAILAVGAVKKVPVIEEDQISIGQRMKLTLSSDHRVIDGVAAALFMRDLKKRIENPMAMVL